MYQTIKNLPAGVYNARVRAFYRAGDADADAEQRKEIEEGREATQNARLYANTTVLGATESRLPLLSTGATEAAIGSGTLQNYFGYVPNDMHTAFDYFEAGQFQHTGVMNYTDDGSLTIGLRKSETIGNDWTLFDEWELEYLGNTDEALARLREQAIAAWPDYAQLIDNNEIPYYGRAAWQTYQQADAALKGATKAADIAAALKQFKEAADAFQKNVEAYAAYAEMFNDANAFVDERQVDLMGEDMELLEEYLGENLEPSATLKHPNGTALYILDNGTLSTDQIAAETKYLEQLRDNALAGGMVDGMDCTNLIKNPHFETADHWVKEGLPEYPAGTDTYKVGQAYTILFGVSQEITGLQNGLYELSLSDFFRPADYGSSDWTENHQAYVFMNNFKRRLNLITDEALNEAIDGHTYEVGGFGYVPNTVEEAAQSFEAGHYKQTLYGLVTDGTTTCATRDAGPSGPTCTSRSAPRTPTCLPKSLRTRCPRPKISRRPSAERKNSIRLQPPFRTPAKPTTTPAMTPWWHCKRRWTMSTKAWQHTPCWQQPSTTSKRPSATIPTPTTSNWPSRRSAP